MLRFHIFPLLHSSGMFAQSVDEAELHLVQLLHAARVLFGAAYQNSIHGAMLAQSAWYLVHVVAAPMTPSYGVAISYGLRQLS